mmetsp:Transcript_31248/g.67323  ORF Transcript_31248/g.67323 Transcript_31248/m.67323 type:complete len:427 (+) Transcript_31248:423-1703(+)
MLSSKIGPLRPVPISPKAPKLVPIAPKVASQSNETLDSAGGSEGASAQTRFQLEVQQNSEVQNLLAPKPQAAAAEGPTSATATINNNNNKASSVNAVGVGAKGSPAKPQALASAAQPLQTAAAAADQHQQQLSLNHLAANEALMKQQQQQAQQAVAMYTYWNMYANMCANMNATKQVALMGNPMANAASAMSAMQCLSPGMATAGYPPATLAMRPGPPLGTMKQQPVSPTAAAAAANMANMANMAAFNLMALPATSAAMGAAFGQVPPLVLGSGGLKVPVDSVSMELQGSRTNSVNSASTTVMAGRDAQGQAVGQAQAGGRHQKRKYEKIRKVGVNGNGGAMDPALMGISGSGCKAGGSVRKASKKCASEASQNKVCSNCGTSTTPFWRKNKNGGLPLCNACGLYFSKNDAMRPKELWKEEASRGA